MSQPFSSREGVKDPSSALRLSLISDRLTLLRTAVVHQTKQSVETGAKRQKNEPESPSIGPNVSFPPQFPAGLKPRGWRLALRVCSCGPGFTSSSAVCVCLCVSPQASLATSTTSTSPTLRHLGRFPLVLIPLLVIFHMSCTTLLQTHTHVDTQTHAGTHKLLGMHTHTCSTHC